MSGRSSPRPRLDRERLACGALKPEWASPRDELICVSFASPSSSRGCARRNLNDRPACRDMPSGQGAQTAVRGSTAECRPGSVTARRSRSRTRSVSPKQEHEHADRATCHPELGRVGGRGEGSRRLRCMCFVEGVRRRYCSLLSDVSSGGACQIPRSSRPATRARDDIGTRCAKFGREHTLKIPEQLREWDLQRGLAGRGRIRS